MTHSQMNLRVPVWLKVWLQEQAATNRRSLTQEVVLRLSDSRSRHRAPSHAMRSRISKSVQVESQ